MIVGHSSRRWLHSRMIHSDLLHGGPVVELLKPPMNKELVLLVYHL